MVWSGYGGWWIQEESLCDILSNRTVMVLGLILDPYLLSFSSYAKRFGVMVSKDWYNRTANLSFLRQTSSKKTGTPEMIDSIMMFPLTSTR